MAFVPRVHEPFESLRFGRVLLAEVAPGTPAGKCRYCGALVRGGTRSPRAHFSAPSAAVRSILSAVERGAAVEALLLGGPGEPLRHEGIGQILRRIRQSAHLATIVLTSAELLCDRDVRRDCGEADTVVAWLPALVDPGAGGPAWARADAWERHVEGIASLRRETRVKLALEIPVHSGRTDGPESRAAWARAFERLRPDRVFVVPDPAGGEPDPQALERLRREIHPAAGAYLPDGSAADVRCYCAAKT
jgi:wyosine [tRNA(Phe)-imidazoG37] synthetase (radical SAM superfamily)